MANARELFDSSIKDAEDLLAHFDAQPKPPPPNAEVLKRAGLIMALTAWETYVEDRAHEELLRNPDVAKGSLSGSFMLAKIEEELKRFHNPDSNKTRKLFRDYIGIDVTTHWKMPGYECAAAKKKLDELLGIRGEIVHRAKKPDTGGPPKAHPVKKQDLMKAIQFLKALVEATEKALSANGAQL